MTWPYPKGCLQRKKSSYGRKSSLPLLPPPPLKKLGNKILGKFFIILDPLPPLKSREFLVCLVWEIKTSNFKFCGWFCQNNAIFPLQIRKYVNLFLNQAKMLNNFFEIDKGNLVMDPPPLIKFPYFYWEFSREIWPFFLTPSPPRKELFLPYELFFLKASLRQFNTLN